MFPFVPEVKSWGYGILAYVDDFLVSPSPYGTLATLSDCRKVSERIYELLHELDLARNEIKGSWMGIRKI